MFIVRWRHAADPRPARIPRTPQRGSCGSGSGRLCMRLRLAHPADKQERRAREVQAWPQQGAVRTYRRNALEQRREDGSQSETRIEASRRPDCQANSDSAPKTKRHVLCPRPVYDRPARPRSLARALNPSEASLWPRESLMGGWTLVPALFTRFQQGSEASDSSARQVHLPGLRSRRGSAQRSTPSQHPSHRLRQAEHQRSEPSSAVRALSRRQALGSPKASHRDGLNPVNDVPVSPSGSVLGRRW